MLTYYYKGDTRKSEPTLSIFAPNTALRRKPPTQLFFLLSFYENVDLFGGEPPL